MSIRHSTLTARAVLPGLAFILLLDGATLAGGPAVREWLLRNGALWSALFLAFPLAYVLAARRPLSVLGYHGRRALPLYLWGVLAGALWRLLDVLVALGVSGQLGLSVAFIPWLLNAVLVVPLFEETFFRGYLQAGLEERLGPAPAILIQALLFAGHPYHVAQGWQKLPSIALFGVIAGLVYWRSRSMAAAYGAHGMANVLPRLIQVVAGI